MSDPIVAFRPYFPWTLAVATTNGDVIIRHLPLSQPRTTHEEMVLFGRGKNTMIKSLRWSSDGDFLVADDTLLAFKHNAECTFLGSQALCPPRLGNGVVQAFVDENDILQITALPNRLVPSLLPPGVKSKMSGLCAVAFLCTPFSAMTVAELARLLVHVELNDKLEIY